VSQRTEVERRTEVVLNQTGHEHRFTGVAQREDYGTQDDPVAGQEMSHDGRNYHSNRHRQSCAWPQSNQYTGRNTGSRPEHGDAIGFG
jgi:hypothetical protein